MKNNVEKIVKALECCHDNRWPEKCKECPYHCPDASCADTMMRDALALIKELTERAEKLSTIKRLLEGDLQDRDRMLMEKVEVVYADFVRDYKIMEEELEGATEEIAALERELKALKEGQTDESAST